MKFDLYFAGIQALELDEYLSSKNCCRLMSYADKPYSRLKMYDECQSKVFMDSGAFGVAHSGKIITLDEYIEFINNTPRPDLFACLDVIPWPLNEETAIESSNKSWENYVYMLEHVKDEYKHKIIPTYHYGENFDTLERMLDGHNGYKPPYIAFGGRNGVHTKHLYSCLDKFFEIIKQKRPDVKTHAFGITVLELLEQYPFTSADSTSYLQTAINGSIFTNAVGVVKLSDRTLKDPKNFEHKPDQYKQLVEDEIKSYGYDINELKESFRVRLRYNVDYFVRWQESYTYKPRTKIKRKSLI